MRYFAPLLCLVLIALCGATSQADDPPQYVADFGRLTNLVSQAPASPRPAVHAEVVSRPPAVNFYRLLDCGPREPRTTAAKPEPPPDLVETLRQQSAELQTLRAELADLAKPPPVVAAPPATAASPPPAGVPGLSYWWTDGNWRTSPQPGLTYAAPQAPGTCRWTGKAWRCD